MTLYQFNALDEMEQAEALWDIGVLIADREDEVHRFILYQLHSFYVEVWLHKEYNTIRRFRSFSSVKQLEPYLDKISLPILSETPSRPPDDAIIDEYRHFFNVPDKMGAGAIRFRLWIFILLTLALGVLIGRWAGEW